MEAGDAALGGVLSFVLTLHSGLLVSLMATMLSVCSGMDTMKRGTAVQSHFSSAAWEGFACTLNRRL